MYPYMIIAEYKFIHPYSVFILQDAVDSTVTIQSNQKNNDTPHNLPHTAYRRRHLQYVKYTKWNGQFIVSPRLPRLSVFADNLASDTDTWKFVTCYYTWFAAGYSVVLNYFYKRPFAVLVAKCALKHLYSRGAWRDRRTRPVQYANWYSRTAQHVRDRNVHHLQNIYGTYCCGKTVLYFICICIYFVVRWSIKGYITYRIWN